MLENDATAGITTISTMAAEYTRNQPVKANIAPMTLSSTNGLIDRTRCIRSVRVGVSPRMCIGKRFHSNRLLIALPSSMSASHRHARVWGTVDHNPYANAATNALDRVKN